MPANDEVIQLPMKLQCNIESCANKAKRKRNESINVVVASTQLTHDAHWHQQQQLKNENDIVYRIWRVVHSRSDATR